MRIGNLLNAWQIALAVVIMGVAGGTHCVNGAEPEPGTRIIHPGDGAVMVYVPAGPFVMGLDYAEWEQVAQLLGFKDGAAIWVAEAFPRHTVDLPGFFVDRCEVTVAQWQRFVEATGHKTRHSETTRHFGNPAARNLPAAEITWAEAGAYAVWAGKALPNEAQWEKAARGSDGRLFPWGNEAPTPEHGHWKGNLYVTVGSFPKGASPYGALDMLGNQYEWTSERKVLYENNLLKDSDPQAAAIREVNDGRDVCLRGGSWYHGAAGFYAAKRFVLRPDETYYHVGFRTVWVPPAGYFESAEFVRHKKAAAVVDTR